MNELVILYYNSSRSGKTVELATSAVIRGADLTIMMSFPDSSPTTLKDAQVAYSEAQDKSNDTAIRTAKDVRKQVAKDFLNENFSAVFNICPNANIFFQGAHA